MRRDKVPQQELGSVCEWKWRQRRISRKLEDGVGSASVPYRISESPFTINALINSIHNISSLLGTGIELRCRVVVINFFLVKQMTRCFSKFYFKTQSFRKIFQMPPTFIQFFFHSKRLKFYYSNITKYNQFHKSHNLIK